MKAPAGPVKIQPKRGSRNASSVALNEDVGGTSVVEHGMVIPLPCARVVADSETVSLPNLAEQEEMILTYRLKARKLGRSILRRWHARIDLDEVDSLVDLSLCEAVKRFDTSKGASFMTFLYYHLKGNLIRAVSAAAAYSNMPGAEVSQGAGEDVASTVNSDGLHVSSSDIAAALSGQEMPQPDEVLYRKQVQNRSSQACEKLDTLEQEIIKRIFFHEQQIMDIAASLGYSRCHISRVKKRALETLYQELTATLGADEVGKGPLFNDESEVAELPERVQVRKLVHRRKPRSKASPQGQRIVAEAA
jgi:RNA polymerase sigma factor (sigma-70 family)